MSDRSGNQTKMDSHKSLKVTLDFVRDVEQLSVDSLIRQGSSFHSDEKLLGNLMEFLFSEQSAEEQALLERFYYQLLRCYRTYDEHLIKFVHQFVFCLIWRHFQDTMKSRQYGITIRPGLDALLIVVYNLMIVDNEGQYKTESYTIPSLANLSLYHDPAEFTVNILKGSAGGRGRSETDEERRVVMESHPPVESLTRTRKWTVFCVLLRTVALDLAYYSRACQKSAIIMGRLLLPVSAASAVRADLELTIRKEPRPFDKLNFKSFSVGKDKNRMSQVVQPKTILDERFLLDFLDILYILAYQGYFDESLGLVTDILDEGEYRFLASVVLLASAIKNRLETGKQDPDELEEVPPIGVSAAEDEKEKPSRKISHSSGSVREKRRKSFMSRKETMVPSGSKDRGGDSVTEVPENENSWRSETPNDSMMDIGDGLHRSAEASPQQSKVSPRTFQGNSPHSSETII
ncbi:hyccin 2-like [Paramacrobiotus metropolitanus]|uniref:hyccin 2-like n=1 Tax=Paramacrobiotus metropolitanus TaxID=2943436 RepID=UPI00244586D6|nr:hyccin 2-like [Paramacrobiotus metropolitanus]